jgi:hypothetical protein
MLQGRLLACTGTVEASQGQPKRQTLVPLIRPNEGGGGFEPRAGVVQSAVRNLPTELPRPAAFAPFVKGDLPWGL